jgi:hypothetical protein
MSNCGLLAVTDTEMGIIHTWILAKYFLFKKKCIGEFEQWCNYLSANDTTTVNQDAYILPYPLYRRK